MCIVNNPMYWTEKQIRGNGPALTYSIEDPVPVIAHAVNPNAATRIRVQWATLSFRLNQVLNSVLNQISV